MPVYNSEEYLDMAINSIINQTLQEWELLLINDGSKDHSLDICKKYEELDERIHVYSHENHGISYTRNRGLQEAKGEYIAFIDNDDEYLPDLLETCYLRAKEADAQVVKYGYLVVEDWHKDFSEGRVRTFRNGGKLELDGQMSYKDLTVLREDGFFNMLWNGIYKKEFMDAYQIRLDDEVTRGYEDWIFMAQMFPHCETIYLITDVKYIHYQRGAHSTSSNFHENQILGWKKALKAEKAMIDYLEKQSQKDMHWPERAMEYFIEFLLIFEKRNCTLGINEEYKMVKESLKEEELQVLRKKEVRDRFPKTQRILAGLVAKNLIRTLIIISKLYNKYIVYKRTRKM